MKVTIFEVPDRLVVAWCLRCGVPAGTGDTREDAHAQLDEGRCGTCDRWDRIVFAALEREASSEPQAWGDE